MQNVIGTTGDMAGQEERITVDGVSVRFLRVGRLETVVDAAGLAAGLLGASSGPEPPYWMHLWPGAMALARILAGAAQVAPGVRLLEFGCGLGLPALIAAARGASVVATDWKPAPLCFLRSSAQLNGQRLGLIQMDWRAPALKDVFDVGAGAEVAYDQATESALIEGLSHAVRPGGMVWLADSVNTFRPSVAARLRAAGFVVGVSRVCEEEDGRPVWVRLIEGRRLP